MIDVMIDLETLSTRPDAAILSIGACYFDIDTGKIGHTFHRNVMLIDAPRVGHISADTVKWWLKQSDDARLAIAEPKNAIDIAMALMELRDFIPGNKQAKFWSNGATFDLVILRSAFDRCGHIVPWQYWQERDTSTIVDIAQRLTGVNVSKSTPFEGVKHDALADAVHQARYVSHAYRLISANGSRQ